MQMTQDATTRPAATAEVETVHDFEVVEIAPVAPALRQGSMRAPDDAADDD